ncbi:hypothetical protein [Hymenobacter wooponensis]|uniref:DUF3887 domain-containing protein n=1 Tax=Hymenobacter wooponensis TaxID=1525360 RepID=A0A4Z0MPH0_9BACT|nr:hypothetical protein [Hymenobacter wooponensis]TGD81340.1 hypothetical protein EU557_07190 [Hymenobacter wooponensis]
MNVLRSFSARFALLGLLVLTPLLAHPAQAPTTQVQVARQFLLAVVRGEWAVAYGHLAPEVRQGLSAQQFQKAAEPLYKQAKHYGPTISLYKLGYRLRDTQVPQPFVAFSYKADTLQAYPHFQLDVTFRDSTARQVLGFGLVPLVAPVK